jgi:hypothetical protein
MDCRDENRLSHTRSFRARNDLSQWKNKDRPATHSTCCSILEASLGRRDECGRPVTNQCEGIGVVLGGRLTQKNLYHRRAKEQKLDSQLNFVGSFSLSIPYSDDAVSQDLALGLVKPNYGN